MFPHQPDCTDTILGTLQPDCPLGGCSGHLFLRGRQRGRWGMGQGRGRAEEERGKRVQGRGEVWHGILQMQRSYSGKWSRASWVFMNLSSWNVVELLDLYSGRSRKDKLVAVLFHRWGNWRLRSKPFPASWTENTTRMDVIPSPSSESTYSNGT